MPSIADLVLNDGTNNVTFKPDSKEGPSWIFTSRDQAEVGNRSPLKVSVRTIGPDNGKRIQIHLGYRVVRTVDTDEVSVATVPMELSVRRPGNITDAEYAIAVNLLVHGLSNALNPVLVDSEAFY